MGNSRPKILDAYIGNAKWRTYSFNNLEGSCTFLKISGVSSQKFYQFCNWSPQFWGPPQGRQITGFSDIQTRSQSQNVVGFLLLFCFVFTF